MGLNSRLKQKKGLCIDCADGVEKDTIAGRCLTKYHYVTYRRSVNKSKQKGGGEKARQDVADSIWFAERRKEMPLTCMCGCGQPTSKHDDKYFRGSVCHIFEKRHFKSVRHHPLNCIFLGLWSGCHSNMDYQSSSVWPKMACWPELVRRFKILYPLITEQEHEFVPIVLLNELEKT